jgi:hypothetical protein
MPNNGNRNWGKPMSHSPTVPTEFKLGQLQLAPEDCASSHQLRSWCLKHRNRCYIPEWLLGACVMLVDPDLNRIA